MLVYCHEFCWSNFHHWRSLSFIFFVISPFPYSGLPLPPHPTPQKNWSLFCHHGRFCHQREGNKSRSHCIFLTWIPVPDIYVCVCVCVWERERETDSIKTIKNTKTTLGAGIAQWLERRTRDWKVAGSNPCWNGGRIFFSRVDFLCWLLFRYPFHPRVTTVARKKSRSFCQKCRWQVTAKHAYILRMWLLLNRASALVTTCP